MNFKTKDELIKFLRNNAFGTCNMNENQKKRFEYLTSSLRKNVDSEFSLEDAKAYSINSITNGITKLPSALPQVYELEKEIPFNFIARVDTSANKNYDIDEMVKQASERKFLSYSLVTEKNISRYETSHDFMLIYDVPPEAIVHVFPVDSDTNIYATDESNVCSQPSIWLTLDELRNFTDEIGMYNQITCKTSINGQMILPKAILVFDALNSDAVEASQRLVLPIVVSHPQKDAIRYVGDSCFVDRNKETADKYKNMISIFRKRLCSCFKTKNGKRLLDSFIESFCPDEMNFIIDSVFDK